jgi:hypothetical protein
MTVLSIEAGRFFYSIVILRETREQRQRSTDYPPPTEVFEGMPIYKERPEGRPENTIDTPTSS